MPIYEYACQACGHEFEYLLRGSESPSCPECRTSLPVCDAPPPSGCGLPQCGMGGCQGGF